MCAELTKPFGMTIEAVTASREPDHERAGCDGPGHADRRVLDYRDLLDQVFEGSSCVEVQVRRGLSSRDVDLAAVDVRLEASPDPEMIEVGSDPLGRAGGCDGDGQTRRQALQERDCTRHCRDAFAQTSRVFIRARGTEALGERSADPALDRSGEISARQTHELGHGLLDTDWMADAGQVIRDLFVAGVFAFDQHAVEIEDQAGEPQLRSPNKVVPIRT